MTLTQAIRREAYLRPSNCCDEADIRSALRIVRDLEEVYGESKTLNSITARLYVRLAKIKQHEQAN